MGQWEDYIDDFASELDATRKLSPPQTSANFGTKLHELTCVSV
jgi:hypothetical protein